MSRAEEGRAYRAKKIAELGADVVKANHARARKARRNGTASTRIPAIPVELVDKVLKAKKKFNKDLGKPPPKRDTVLAQLKKVDLLHRKLHNEPLSDSMEWARNSKAISLAIRDNWPNENTQISHFSALASILPAWPELKRARRIYSGISTMLRGIVNDETKENRHRPDMLSWNAITAIKPGDNRSKAIAGIFTMMAPRRSGTIGKLALAIGSEVPGDVSKNWLVIGNPSFMVYNVYKTSDTYGQQIIVIPVELEEILLEYIEDAGIEAGEWLFPNARGKVFANFSSQIPLAFGVPGLGSNMLRHSFIADFLSTKRTVKEREAIGWKMAHSVATQALYDSFPLG